MIPPRLLALVFAVLAALTAALGAADRFEVTGPELLAPMTAPDPLSAWTAREKPGGRVGSADDAAVLAVGYAPCTSRWVCMAEIKQTFPAGGTGYVRASVELKLDDIELARRTDRGPSVYLASNGPGAPTTWHPAHRPLRLGGSAGWRTYEQTYTVTDTLPEWTFVVHLTGAGGRVSVRRPSLRLAVERPWWRLGAWALAAGWMLALGLGAVLVMRGPGLLARAAIVAAAVAILAGTTVPDPVLEAVRPPFVFGASEPEAADRPPPPAVDARRPEAPPPAPPPIVQPSPSLLSRLRWDKLGHYGGFLVLGFVGAAAERRRARVLALGLAFAVATELLQMLTLDRTARVFDLGLDGVGLLTGIALHATAARLARLWRRGAPVV